MELIGWTKEEYGGSNKNYMGGLVIGSVSWAMTGNRGYIAKVGRITLKKRFEYMDDAKLAIDVLVKKRCMDYISK